MLQLFSLSLLLSKGEVVAWFQGKSEFGQRALGSRSILADPRWLIRAASRHIPSNNTCLSQAHPLLTHSLIAHPLITHPFCSTWHALTLTNPRNTDVRRFVNEKVKEREWYRPLAPSVLDEYSGDWFEGLANNANQSPYMSFTGDPPGSVVIYIPPLCLL